MQFSDMLTAPGHSDAMAQSCTILYVSDMLRWIPQSRVTLRWCDVFVCAPDWSWRVGRLPHLDLWYVMEGVGWLDDGQQRTPIGAGDCVLMRRGGAYRAGHDPERPLSFIAVHFDLLGEDGRVLEPPREALPPFLRHMEAGSLLHQILTRALQAYRDGSRAWAHAWLQAALMEVVRQDTRTWPPGLAGDRARAVEAICERIRRHPGRVVRVEDLAAELGVSPEHFGRLFRRFQGLTPRAFITRTRIEAAQTLLLTSSHSITRIAELLGYESPFYFSRQFKAKVGLSPRAFRHGGRRPAERTGD